MFSSEGNTKKSYIRQDIFNPHPKDPLSMRKLFPVLLMSGILFSLSSFAPVHRGAPVTMKHVRVYSFPITGTTDGTPGAGQPAGTIAYTVNGSGTTPTSITFSTLSGTSLGTYGFTQSSPNNYLATGMKTQTSISGTYFHISGACGSAGYCMEFIGAL